MKAKELENLLEAIAERRIWRQQLIQEYTMYWQEGLISGKELNHKVMSFYSLGVICMEMAKSVIKDCKFLDKWEVWSSLVNNESIESAYDFNRNIADDKMLGVDNG